MLKSRLSMQGAIAPHLWISSDSLFCRSSDKFQIGFYNSDATEEALLNKVSDLAMLGRFGVDYGNSTSRGTNNLSADQWKLLSDNGIKTSFAFAFLSSIPTGGSPVAGTSIDSYVADLYATIYSQALAMLSDPVKRAVVDFWCAYEEVRYWNSSDMAAVHAFVSAIRDAEKAAGATPRPIYEYQPQHADAGRLNSYHGIFDIETKGAYVQVGSDSAYSTVLNAVRGSGWFPARPDRCAQFGRDRH